MKDIVSPATSTMSSVAGPSVKTIQTAREFLTPYICATPIWKPLSINTHPHLQQLNSITLKMELMQHTGSFKVRATTLAISQLSETQRNKGVFSLSAGNHAMAVSYTAKQFNTPCTVIMPTSAPEVRQQFCRDMGASIVLLDSIEDCFDKVDYYKKKDLYFIHPFEGETVATGTGTLGLEILEQAPETDAVVCAVGGGGLCGGVANIIKQIKPSCKVFAVEPEGANSMTRSFLSGKPESAGKINTIADSLSAPYAEEYSYSLCAQYVDGIVNVSDSEIKQAMLYCFNELKLVTEPACAAAIAAIFGPLQPALTGKSVMVVMCGSNIDIDTFLNKAL